MISILILQPPTPGLSLRLGSFDGFLIGEWCLFAYSIKPLFDIDENSYGLDNSGGLLIYGTVYTFSHYFDEPQEEDGLADLGGGVI